MVIYRLHLLLTLQKERKGKHMPLPFLYLYVDDILTALPFDKMDAIVSAFNNYHHRYLQFTCEVEIRNAIPFSNLLVIRSGNRMKMDWYQNSLSSSTLLNSYNSSHANVHKIIIIKPLTQKVLILSSSEFHKTNIQKDYF